MPVPVGTGLQDDRKEEGFTSRAIRVEIVLIFPFIFPLSPFPLTGKGWDRGEINKDRYAEVMDSKCATSRRAWPLE